MDVLNYLKDNIVIMDGGMGTLLQGEGLLPGELPEVWNISHKDVIRRLNKEYFDAGSNIVCANTFGANLLKFSEKELEKIIYAAIENAFFAREASAATQEKFVALDMGPLGRLLKPYGDFDFEDAVTVFKKTVEIGTKYGADLILAETLNDSYETKAALLAAKEKSALPVFVSNAYGSDQKLMTGASPEAMVALLEGMGADAVGVNCSLGPRELSGVMERILKYSSVPVMFKPNAGLPKRVGQKTVYDVSPQEFSEEVLLQIKAGARAVGGCCGTTPEYIREIVKKAAGMKPLPVTDKEIMCVSSYTHTVEIGSFPVLIGERINPTGKKRFKQALLDNDTGYILQEGIRQQEHGVHILDVNVGLPEIDEASALQNAVSELQAVVNLPLQIDTADARAMEGALRLYNGKAMVNSVSGKESVMRSIFPLVKKYGGVLVALTLDDDGIPKTAEGRVKIAEKILNTAKEYGISKKNIIFDPLAMAVSADPAAPSITLKAIRLIREKLGCRTSLGVSNVSFGLPARGAINGAFFSLALENGLSAAIMNPYSCDMMKAYFSYKALKGMDENFGEYIAFSEKISEDEPKEIINRKKKTGEEDISALKRAVSLGLKDEAARITKELLVSQQPLDIVKQDIIPALDAVGVGFENKTIYLPQLLMSAEAAKSSFEIIKTHMISNKGSVDVKCKFVIATVHGDIHDIGKNIVKLLLENYGFGVIDLGKDVPPEEIVSAVVESKAPIVGLSALMTTTVPAMEKTVKLLRKEAPWCSIAVGGAVLTGDYAKSIGADKYCRDAMETVRYAEKINKKYVDKLNCE